MPRPIANPPNPWFSSEVDYLPGENPGAQLQVFEDQTKNILSENDSPDIFFRWSINPYRGCYHGCLYCYARPSHQYLSFGAGTDFDRKITVKPRAAELLRAAFARPKWVGEVIVFSGNTDCYQPLEASYKLTQACLQVCLEHHQPVSIITKAPLIERDLALLVALHQVTHISVTVSIPVADREHAHVFEPYVATPQRRLATIATLAKAGLDVGINVAPLIPSVTEKNLEGLLRAAREAGAVRAGCTFLRLPGPVQSYFQEKVREKLPQEADKILNLVRISRGGRLNEPRFGARMEATGPYGQAALQLFSATVDKVGLNQTRRSLPLEPSTFRRPLLPGAQLGLFE